MPWIIGIFVFLLILHFFDRYPAIGHFIGYLILLAAFVALIGWVRRRWNESATARRWRWEKEDRQDQKLARAEQAAALHVQQDIRAKWLNSFPPSDYFIEDLTRRYRKRCEAINHKGLLKTYLDQLIHAAKNIYTEEFPTELPEPYDRYMTDKLTNPEQSYELLIGAFVDGFTTLTSEVHPLFITRDNSTETTFSIHHNIRDLLFIPMNDGPEKWKPEMMGAFHSLTKPFRELHGKGVFDVLKTVPHHKSRKSPERSDYSTDSKYDRAYERYWEIDEKAYDEEYAKLTPWELISAGTPFFKHAHLLEAPSILVETFPLPQKTRFEGQWIVARQGRGKTTLLLSQVYNDFKSVVRNQASVIIMDSKGDLINEIKTLKLFAPGQPLHGKLVLIEPDPDHPLALNPLDITRGDENLSRAQKKARSNRTIVFLEYIFSALLEAKMTPLQATMFRSVLRALVEVIPDPTIETFRDIITNGYEPYREYLKTLDKDDRDFFTKDQFGSKTYTETRQQLMWRLRLLMDNYVIKSMFTAPRTKVDLAREMDSAKVILINNSKDLLEDNGAEFFGRFFIALVRRAAEQRSSLPHDKKMPTYFYIDECHTVISRDDNIATIIDECRSQKIGLIAAHQRLDQITSPNVRGALANCGIRLANVTSDGPALAAAMHAPSPEFLNQPVGSFAALVADVTPAAVLLHVDDPPVLDKMTPAEQEQILLQMRLKYSTNSEAPPPTDEPDDLHWEITISPRVAEQGGDHRVAETLTVRIPSGTKHGSVLRVRGKGNPKPDGTCGDLYLHICVPLRPNQRLIDSTENSLNEWG